jgi:hypothetical protein
MNGHDAADHVAADCLDVQRGSPQQPVRERVVDMRLNRTGTIKGLAESDDPGIGVDSSSQHIANSAVRSGSIEVIFKPASLAVSTPSRESGGAHFVGSSRAGERRGRRTIILLVKYHNMFIVAAKLGR